MAFTVYPRTGGEHFSRTYSTVALLGLSPHRRGTLAMPHIPDLVIRFIPAQAGNTAASGADPRSSPVYPRTGGEHDSTSLRSSFAFGLSPHRRGTRGLRRLYLWMLPVYPRTGGEHINRLVRADLSLGLSPHRRGTHVGFDGDC